MENVEIEHLDGGTTEIVDVVTPEPLGNPDENLADRLWDQVEVKLDNSWREMVLDTKYLL